LRVCVFQQTTTTISKKNYKYYSKYIKASTKYKNTKIVAKLNNIYKNFKIANLLQQNTKTINNKKLQNY